MPRRRELEDEGRGYMTDYETLYVVLLASVKTNLTEVTTAVRKAK